MGVINIPSITHVWNWLRAIGRWFAEFKHLWLALLVCVVALVVALRPPATEPTIRLTGLALQLLGIGTVAWGIAEARALFGHPSTISVARSWLVRFPQLGPKTVSASINITLPGLRASMRGYATHGPEPNATLDARVEVLEKNIAGVNERLDQTQREMDDQFRDAKAALKQAEEIWFAEGRAIHEKLEATGTGGVHISAIGALWLFVGVTLSTASPEISRWLQ